jgi:hypothetical protein
VATLESAGLVVGLSLRPSSRPIGILENLFFSYLMAICRYFSGG